MRSDALQTFKNITSPNRENLEKILPVFRRKNTKPQSVATAKHNYQRLVFNPVNQKLIDFGRTAETDKNRNQSSRSGDHRAIHICQNANHFA